QIKLGSCRAVIACLGPFGLSRIVRRLSFPTCVPKVRRTQARRCCRTLLAKLTCVRGHAAVCQTLRLLDAVFLRDATLPPENLVELLDVGSGPTGDVIVAMNAVQVKQPFDVRRDTLHALQMMPPQTCWWRLFRRRLRRSSRRSWSDLR